MLVVQVGRWNGGDEELGPIGSFHGHELGFGSLQEVAIGSVPGPAFAIERRNGFVCFSSKFSSSNFSP